MNKDHPQIHTRRQKAIQSVRNIRLTAEEKNAMLARILVTPATAIAPIKSPWTIYALGSWSSRNRWSYALIAVLIVSLSGGGIALAAENSLPGDALYPVKVDVAEPLQTALAPSPTAKARLAASFAAERIQEGEKLAAQGKLDQAKQAQLSTLIQDHTQALNDDLAAVASSNPQVADSISTDFQARMQQGARQLEMIAGASATTSSASSTNNISTTAVVAASTTMQASRPSALQSRTHNQRNSPRGPGRNAIASPVASSSPVLTAVASSTGTSSETPKAPVSMPVNAPANTPDNSAGSHGHNNGNRNTDDQGDSASILSLAASVRANSDKVSSWNKNNDHGNNNDRGNHGGSGHGN